MERGSFTEIDHTADIGLDLKGPTPEAILEAAQRGLVQLLFDDTSDLVADDERRVALTARDWPELLKRWCERLYELLESEGFVALDTEVEKTELGDLRAVVRGTAPSRDRVAAASELKAVTYHQLAFEPGEEGWRARVIFDV